MVRPILRYADPVLRARAIPFAPGEPGLAELAADLLDTLAATANGIGLAAQQIGFARPVCVVDVRGGDEPFRFALDGRGQPPDLWMPLVLVNPQVRAHHGPETVVEEGCLSFPELRGPVPRREAITVAFTDLRGVPHTLEADGLLGRCLQHEIDHLEGVLFIDRMDRRARRRLDAALRTLKAATAATGAEAAVGSC